MSRLLKGMFCLMGLVLLLAGCKIDESASMGQQAAAGDSAKVAAEQGAGTNQAGGWTGPDSQVREAFQRMNRLAIGSLYLQTTDHPITAEQAAVLLPLWQSLQSSMQPGKPVDDSAGTPAPPDETQITSALDGIDAALTAEQKDILNGQSEEQLWDWAQAQGLRGAEFGGPQGDGTPGPRPDGSQGGPPGDGTPGPRRFEGTPPVDFTPPADFTPGAGGGRGGFAFGSPLIDEVITMLQGLAGK